MFFKKYDTKVKQELQKRQGNPAIFAVIAVILISAAVLAFFAACGKSDTKKKSEGPVISAASVKSVEDHTQESLSTEEENYVPVSEEPEIVNAWADAYYDYLIDFDRKYGKDGYDGLECRTYDYIYVNDDDVPELILQGQDEATGNLILTYSDGKIDELQTSRLYFDYIEKENRLRNSEGHMGYYYDYIYTIKDGKWEIHSEG